jgi:hypothetical protein
MKRVVDTLRSDHDWERADLARPSLSHKRAVRLR